MLLLGEEMSTVLMGGPNCQHGLVPVREQQGHYGGRSLTAVQWDPFSSQTKQETGLCAMG